MAVSAHESRSRLQYGAHMDALLGRAAPPGSTIGVVTPGSPPETRAEVQRATAWWESQGYRVKLARGALERDDWHAGSPTVRAHDLQESFADPEIDAIQCMRGGYGSAQVIPLVDFEAIAATPKVVRRLLGHHGAPRRTPPLHGSGDLLRPGPDDLRQSGRGSADGPAAAGGARRRRNRTGPA
jgi:LD-carboxypeptidase N-terminal domain